MSSQGRQQQVVLVTGCNQGGIGFNLCKQLAGRGYQVVATAPDTRDMAELAALGCSLATLDVTSTTSIDKAVGRMLADHGRIDILVNNAGILITGDRGQGWRRMREEGVAAGRLVTAGGGTAAAGWGEWRQCRNPSDCNRQAVCIQQGRRQACTAPHRCGGWQTAGVPQQLPSRVCPALSRPPCSITFQG
jgi:hypothetical protein